MLYTRNFLSGDTVGFETDPWDNEDDNYDDCMQQEEDENVFKSEEFCSIIAPYERKLKKNAKWWCKDKDSEADPDDPEEEEQIDVTGDGGVLKTVVLFILFRIVLYFEFYILTYYMVPSLFRS